MDNYNPFVTKTQAESQRTAETAYAHTIVANNSKKLLAASFSWMTLALVISTISAMLFDQIDALKSLLVTAVISANGEITGKITIFGWITMLAPLGLVILMSVRVRKMSYAMLALCFVIFSAVNGMSLSFVVGYYSSGSIISCFLSTAGLFGLFAVAGYFTRTDLTKLGSILSIALIAIIIASLVNFFVGSSTMDYLISIIGIAIFTGLTAYDVQKLKNLGNFVTEGEALSKVSIMGALELYLDFINLFLFILRIFGSRD